MYLGQHFGRDQGIDFNKRDGVATLRFAAEMEGGDVDACAGEQRRESSNETRLARSIRYSKSRVPRRSHLSQNVAFLAFETPPPRFELQIKYRLTLSKHYATMLCVCPDNQPAPAIRTHPIRNPNNCNRLRTLQNYPSPTHSN